MRFVCVILAVLGVVGAAAPDKPLFQALKVGARRVPFDAPGEGMVPFDTLGRALGVKIASRPSDPSQHACFRLRDAAPMRLIFVGDDMGGDALMEFILAPAGTVPELEDRCPPLAVSSANIATDSGLRLGLTRGELETLLGAPADSTEDDLVFRSTVHRIVSTSPGETDSFDLHFEITATLRGGRVVALQGDVTDED